jgi:RNA polymerase sigma-70 factor (ECF subfamily)
MEPAAELAASRRGEPSGVDVAQAFAPIAAAYQAPLARYLYGMVGDVELAHDLTQETLLSAYRAWPTEGPIHTAAWLYRIATNHALSSLRRRKLLAWVSLSRLVGVAHPTTPGPADRIALAESVAEALKQLDPKDRACLLLKAAGFSAEEIGGQLGCSAGAARTRLGRARETFRRAYRSASGEEES